MSTTLLLLLLAIVIILLVVWMASGDEVVVEGTKIQQHNDPTPSSAPFAELSDGWVSQLGDSERVEADMQKYFPTTIGPVPGETVRANSGTCIAGKAPSGPLPLVDVCLPLLKEKST